MWGGKRTGFSPTLQTCGGAFRAPGVARGPRSRLSTLGAPGLCEQAADRRQRRPQARSGRVARVPGQGGPFPESRRGLARRGRDRRPAPGHLRGAARPRVLPAARPARTGCGRRGAGARAAGGGWGGAGGWRPSGFPESGGGAGGLRRRGGRTRQPPALLARPPASTQSRRQAGMGAARALPAPTPV